MRLVLFGAAGMLGTEVMREAERMGQEVRAFTHSDCDIADRNQVADYVWPGHRDDDVWLNCAGALQDGRHGYLASPDTAMIKVNALGPHVLATMKPPATRLIHVSTDGVFSGSESHFICKAPADTPDPVDLYGASKLVGEHITHHPHVTVVRTSFMGMRSGLMRMVVEKAAVGENVVGHARSYWSGSTVDAVARALINLARDSQCPSGIQHLATTWPISKADALHQIIDTWGLQNEVVVQQEPFLRRGLVATLALPAFKTALSEYRTKQGK